LFRLKLFGGATIDGPTGPLTGRAVQRRRLALLALLSVGRGRGLSRDKLIAYLWPDSDAERARHLLSDSIYRINQAVAGEAIVAVGDELRLDPDVVSNDVWEFGEAIERGEWERAVELQTAPFLDGFFLTGADEFERWAAAEQERHARERGRAIEALANVAESNGDDGAAARWWRALAADDPYNSRIALRLMRALERSGERAAAVQHARIHAVLVRDEMGVEADAEVLAFAERLRRAPRDAAPAPVIEAVTASTPPGPAAVPGGPAPLKRPKPALLLAAVLAVVLILGWVSLRFRNGATPPGPTAIAVIPFADLSSARDQEYFADGITEELIVKLSKLEGLAVVGRTSVFAVKDQSADVRDIAQRLGVSAVLAGSVRKSGDRLRISAQLVNAADGYELWSETYERQMEDVFAIQDDISRAIVTRLRGRLTGEDVTRLAVAGTEDPAAYNLYLKGRFEWHKRTEQGLRNAAAYFQQALDRAPDYARAHAGLGDAFAVLGFYDYLPPAEAFPNAAAAARRALQLDASLAEAHATLGYVALYYDWDWERAETEFRLTIDLDPGYSTGRQWYANLLTAMGRFDEAVHEMRAAQELDPLSLIANAALGWVLYYAGDHERAVDQLARTLELNPEFELAHLWRGQALEQMGRTAEGFAELERAVQLSGGSAISSATLARARAIAGDHQTARNLLRQLEDRSGAGYVPAYEIAKVYEALGEPETAIAWLEQAYRQRSHSMVFLAVDPQLVRLRERPGYLRLLEQVGLVSQPAK
jgi:TolB-like protein/DNA-binding SARP family transcriptional activator/Tfp pilus assembly protein PilF